MRRGRYWWFTRVVIGLAIPAVIAKMILENPGRFDLTDWILAAIGVAVLIAAAMLYFFLMERSNRR